MADSPPPDPVPHKNHPKKKNRPVKKTQVKTNVSQSAHQAHTNAPTLTEGNVSAKTTTNVTATAAKTATKTNSTLRPTAQEFLPPSLMVPSSVAVSRARDRAGGPSKKAMVSPSNTDAVDSKEQSEISSQNKKKKLPPKKQNTNSIQTPVHSAPDYPKQNGNKTNKKNKHVKTLPDNKNVHDHDNHHHHHNDNDMKDPEEKGEEEGEICLLCANVITCAAVGRCNHPICHICSLRMRVKNGEKHCPVCKDDSEVVIVYKVHPPSESSPALEPTFASFNLDIHAMESPLPGVEVLPQAQMLFVDAHASFAAAGKLLALSCPQCHLRCRSDAALHQHVKEKHNLQFCHLCYTHRPLFTSEMRLMTTPQLQAHMDAAVTSSTSTKGQKGDKKKKASGKGVGEDVAAGHQLCRFCSTYFYDTQGLYVHMRDEHFTCHLCPAADRHRYYKNLGDLLQHLSSTHFLCTLCLNAQMASSTGMTDHGAGVVAFKRQGEYAEHMLSSHNIKSASSSYSSLSSHIQASFSVKSSSSSSASSTASPGYLDLQFSSSDPYSLDPDSTSPPPSRRQQAQSRRRTSNSVTGVPSEHPDDFPPPQANYPTLSASSGTSGSKSSTSSAAAATSAAHPLSLTHKIAERKRAAAALKEEELRQKEIQKAFEARRELRNTAFADALGLGSKSLMQTVRVSATAAAGGCDRGSGSGAGLEVSTSSSDLMAIEQHVYDNLAKVPLFYEIFRPENPYGLVHVPKELSYSSSVKIKHLLQILRRPLYSTELISWAKNHRMDLIKVEKKIQELISDESATSCQLKPMKKWSLDSIHMLAKYYGLNSQQFFSTNSKPVGGGREKEGVPAPPTQYLSLIKTADSAPPAVLLSSAALPYTLNAQYAQDVTAPQQVELLELLKVRERMTTHGILHPTLFFLINTKKYGAGTTVGDFICQLKSLVEAKRPGSSDLVGVAPEDRIIELVCVGNGLIKVSLNTFAAATRLLNVVTSCHGTAPSLPMQWESPLEMPASQLLNIALTEKFFISAHFSEEDVEFASFMDEQIDEDFRNEKRTNPSSSDGTDKSDSAVDEEKEIIDSSWKGDGGRSEEDGPLEEWDSFTPEHMERVSQSLAEKRTALQMLEAKQNREESAARSAAMIKNSTTSSASRPDVPTQPLMTLSVFSRERLPAPTTSVTVISSTIDQDLPPGFISSTASASKSKISVHKFKGTAIASAKEEPDALADQGEVLDSAEEHDLRVAIAASLRDAQLHDAQRQYEHLKISPRTIPDHVGIPSAPCESGRRTAADSSSLFGGDPRPGVYKAPRGPPLPPAASSSTTLETTSRLHEEAIEFLREPIVVPQELKQSITYPVRYTYDRRNHRQEVQNAFSVLQNGEIDTYYRSDDDDDDEKEEENEKTEEKREHDDSCGGNVVNVVAAKGDGKE